MCHEHREANHRGPHSPPPIGRGCSQYGTQTNEDRRDRRHQPQHQRNQSLDAEAVDVVASRVPLAVRHASAMHEVAPPDTRRRKSERRKHATQPREESTPAMRGSKHGNHGHRAHFVRSGLVSQTAPIGSPALRVRHNGVPVADRTVIDSALRASFDAELEEAGFSRSRRVWMRPAAGYEQRVGLDSAHGRHTPVFGLFHQTMLQMLWPGEALDPNQVSQCFALGSTTKLIGPARVAMFTADQLIGNSREGVIQGLREDLAAVIGFLDGLPTTDSVIDLLTELLDKPTAASPFVVPATPGLIRFSIAALATVANHPMATAWRSRAHDDVAERDGPISRKRLAVLTEAAATRS